MNEKLMMSGWTRSSASILWRIVKRSGSLKLSDVFAGYVSPYARLVKGMRGYEE